MSDKMWINSRPFRILHRPVSVTPITKLTLLHFCPFCVLRGWLSVNSFLTVWHRVVLTAECFLSATKTSQDIPLASLLFVDAEEKPCVRKCSFLAHVTRLRDIFWNCLHQQRRFLGSERFKITYLLSCWDARYLGVFTARFVKSWW